MAHVVEWDGKNVPDGMRSLRPGRYVIEPIDESTSLSPEEEAGLEEALAAVDAGKPGATAEKVRKSLRPAKKR